MENGTNGQSDYLGKRFECYEIEWQIENFCVATCGDAWMIQSPEFTIKGLHSTTWLMTLNCEKHDSGDKLKLTVTRSLTDMGPESILVDWRCTIPGLSEEFGSDSLMNAFDKGMSFDMDLGTVEDVIKKFDIFESDSLTISSGFIFFSGVGETVSEPCHDSGVNALSDKLLQLFRSNKVHLDLKLKFEDGVRGIRMISIHKVVVCSRIKELNYLLEKAGTREEDENGEYDVLDLSYLNFDAMMRILEYTYSGNLKFILQTPTFDVCDCVNKLQISELKPFFIPNKLVFRTFVDSQEFNFTWIIPDVKDLLTKESISSPLFSDGCSDKVFQVHFAPKSESQADFCGLHIQSKECSGKQNACFECAIADENNSCLFIRRSWISTEDTEMYGFNEYLRRNMIKYFADKKCLRIVVRLRLSNGSMSSCIEKHNVTFSDYMTPAKSFELLSNCMQAAYETGFFSDLHVSISGTTFRLHRSVLYARCAKLYLLGKLAKENIEAAFDETEPRIFHMVMKYLYSGIVYNNENEADVTEIYDLAGDLRLSFLRNICSTFMKALIQYNPSIRDKVASVAEKHKDDGLLEALKECISDLD